MRCLPLVLLVLMAAMPRGGAAQAKADQAASEGGAIASLDQLLAEFLKLKGLSARYQEEKHIALLKRPLHSEGRIDFAAPNLLLRRTERPEAATLLLEGDLLRIADTSGVRSIDLRASSIARDFVRTFVYVLSGDRAALDRLYTLRFEYRHNGQWRLALTPKSAELKRVIKHAAMEGHGVIVSRMTLVDANGDTTLMTFSDVKTDVHRDAAQRARLFRLPTR